MHTDAYPDPRSTPALSVAACLALGIATANALGPERPFAWLGAALVCGAAAAFVALAGRRRLVSLRALASTLLLGAAAFAFGGALLARHYAARPDSIGRLVADATNAPGLAVRLDAVVLDVPSVGSTGSTRFSALVAGIVLPGRVLAASGRVQVTLGQRSWLPAQAYPMLRRGDRVRLSGTLRALPLKRNPADFDYGRYLRRQGAHATLSVYEAGGVRWRGSTLGPLGRAVERTRRYVESALVRYVPTEEGRAIQRALVLGDRSGMTRDATDALARTGLLHLLAVSGMHVLLVGLLLYELLRGVLLRAGMRRLALELWRAAITLGVLVVYCVLTGASASVVRATVMAAVLVVGNVMQRSSPPLNGLGVAAIAVLVARPTQLFEPGFQLSFGAVAGLIALGPVIELWLPEGRWRRRPVVSGLVTTLVASLAATVATLPILLYHFGRLPIGGLALNLVAIPLTTFAFGAALALLILAPFPALAAPFGEAADVLARGLVWCAEAGDRWLGALAYEGYAVHAFALAALAGVAVTLALWPRRRVRWKAVGLTLALASAGVWHAALRSEVGPRLDVVFFDVGQGDAALLTLPSGRHVLVDTGLRDKRTDAGLRTILPHLRRYGVRSLDALVLTHPHSDHAGGAAAVLRAVPVHRLIHNGDNFLSDVYRETAHLSDSLGQTRGLRTRAVRAGDTLALDPAVRIEVLGPETNDAHPANTNDASVVLRVVYGRTSFLLMGDAEANSEAALVARYGARLRSSVVKVGHHGSRTSSAPPFVSVAAGPGCTAVVSVAETNVYRLPSPETVLRWRRACPHVWLTSDGGALWLRSDGERVRQVAWR